VTCVLTEAGLKTHAVSLLNRSLRFKKTTATTLSTTSGTVFAWARWCMEWSICV